MALANPQVATLSPARMTGMNCVTGIGQQGDWDEKGDCDDWDNLDQQDH